MCLLQLPCTVEYLYRYLHMLLYQYSLYQYRTQKTRYRGKAKCWAAATREKTFFLSTYNSCNGNMYTSVSQQWKGCFQQMKYVVTLEFNVAIDRAVCLPITIRLGCPPIEFMSADPFTWWLMMLKTITVQLPGQYWHIIYPNEFLYIGYRCINFMRTIGSNECVGRSN